MKKYITVCGENAKENLKEAIIAIGGNLIEKADEICNDIEDVREIEIHALITPAKVVNYTVSKNYNATFIEVEPKEVK